MENKLDDQSKTIATGLSGKNTIKEEKSTNQETIQPLTDIKIPKISRQNIQLNKNSTSR